MNIWGLPGPADFLEAVERSLRDGASVVVRFPRRMTVRFDDAVQERCDFIRWTVFRPDGSGAPCKGLLERFAPKGTSLPDLCEAPDFQGRLIWIDSLDRDTWPECKEFLTDYAQFSRNVPQLGRTRFIVCLVGAPPEKPPQRDAALDVHEWKNVVNEMDLLFLAYGRLGERDVNNTMRSLLATTVSRVAMWDLDVAERLLGEDDDKIIDPVRVLRSIAREEGWTCTTPADWALGTASATGAIHAALSALDEPPRELHRRIWSAQASVLLPIIDERRYEIVRENHGQISTHLNMDGDLTDPFDLDIGRLKGMVQRPGFSRHISNVVRRLHETRNDLAHLKPLGLSAIRTLVHT